MSCVVCSVHTKASGDHRTSTRCVSRILACALRRDTMAAAALYVSPLLCTPWTGGANGERLAFLPIGRFLSLPLFLSLLGFFPFLYLILFLGVYSSRRTLVIISRKISFSRPRRRERNSIVHVDCQRTGVASSVVGETLVRNRERKRGGNKSVRRGWKRNCFVSESTVCVLAWLTPWSPLPPFLLLDRHTVSPSLALCFSPGWEKKIRTYFREPVVSFPIRCLHELRDKTGSTVEVEKDALTVKTIKVGIKRTDR